MTYTAVSWFCHKTLVCCWHAQDDCTMMLLLVRGFFLVEVHHKCQLTLTEYLYSLCLLASLLTKIMGIPGDIVY